MGEETHSVGSSTGSVGLSGSREERRVGFAAAADSNEKGMVRDHEIDV